MDGLALLCNLHADGPLTLRRLRQAGIRSLSELERAPRESLASVLRSSNHQAHRFLIEAGLLRHRIDKDDGATSLSWTRRPGASAAPSTEPKTISATGLTGDAFSSLSQRTARQEPTPQASASEATPTREASEEAPKQASGKEVVAKERTFKLPKGARRPMGYDTSGGVVDKLDMVGKRGARSAPQPLPTPPAGVSPSSTPVKEATSEVEIVSVKPLLPRSEPALRRSQPNPIQAPHLPHEIANVQGTLLRHGQIPGLDAPTLERLIAQGVRTYRALVDLTSLPLARRSGIPYTRLLDLRYHARRFLARRLFPQGELPTPLPRPAAPSRASSNERPAKEKELGVVLTPEPPYAPDKAPTSSARTDRSYDVPRPDPVSPESFAIGGTQEDSPGIAGPFV